MKTLGCLTLLLVGLVGYRFGANILYDLPDLWRDVKRLWLEHMG